MTARTAVRRTARITARVAVLLTFTVLGACGTTARLPASPVPTSFAEALARSTEATVGVYGVHADPPEAHRVPKRPLPAPGGRAESPSLAQLRTASIGAGFVVRADGLVVTAAHVVADARDVVVKLHDRRVLQAEVLGFDEEVDIALLKVALPAAVTPPLGRSATLRPGDWVLAVGEPYGLDRSVVAGIVGGVDRHFVEDRDILFIQTDLALNPGNSGGPLIDERGDIVGMNSRIVVGGFGAPGLALTIPIEVVLQIVTELEAGEAAQERPRLGARFEDVAPPVALQLGLTHARGALVQAVSPGSLAEAMGLREADVIVAINERAIEHSADLARSLLGWRQGASLVLTVVRDGGVLTLRTP
jgi:serine protease Do